LVQNGDIISIDAQTNRLDLKISKKEFNKRKNKWKPPKYKFSSGILYKYIKNVSSASEGCVTDN